MESNYIFKFGYNYFLIIVVLIINSYRNNNEILLLLFMSILTILIIFFRIPKITLNKDNNVITSPAFGRVQKIIINEKNILISIFLSLLSPHIQYIPYDGYISKQYYKKGKFELAFMFKKSNNNEKMIHEITTKIGKIKVIQIAGILVRSIISFIKLNDKVKKGEEMGLIKFGSRVDIIVPKLDNMKILVKKNSYIKGGDPLIILTN